MRARPDLRKDVSAVPFKEKYEYIMIRMYKGCAYGEYCIRLGRFEIPADGPSLYSNATDDAAHFSTRGIIGNLFSVIGLKLAYSELWIIVVVAEFIYSFRVNFREFRGIFRFRRRRLSAKFRHTRRLRFSTRKNVWKFPEIISVHFGKSVTIKVQHFQNRITQFLRVFVDIST